MPLCFRRRASLSVQIAHEFLESIFIGGVVFVPGAEIGDEVLANFGGGVVTSVGVEELPGADGFVVDKADREQHLALLSEFFFARVRDLSFHPAAVHAVLGEDQQQAVVNADGFVNLLVNLFAASHVVRGEPAADAFVLEVGVEAVGEGLVLGRVADKAGVELDGLVQQGWEIGDEVFG